jgi:maltoporin
MRFYALPSALALLAAPAWAADPDDPVADERDDHEEPDDDDRDDRDDDADPPKPTPGSPLTAPFKEPGSAGPKGAPTSPTGGFTPKFFAGSYGRVQAATDLRGGAGDRNNIARFGPRLELGPYMELDLGFTLDVPDDGPQFTVLITPALSGDLFHYDGKFGDDLALRNFYVEAKNVAKGVPLSFWAGSRMYRGDDIYLLDFWPLDNLNTYGGGAGFTPGNTEVALQVGVNRLSGDNWQVQNVNVATPDSVKGEQVLFLDRQKTIGSLRLSQRVPLGEALTFRAKLYGELHGIPAGQRNVGTTSEGLLLEDLPKDIGSTMGLQLSLWGWAEQSFVHLWFRRSTGLAAYGELAIPKDGLSLDLSTKGAEQYMIAATGNTETKWVGVVAAAYAAYTLDADSEVIDFDDRWEVVGVVRPTFYATRFVALGAELSHQYVRPNGLNPRTSTYETGNATKISFLPALQIGRGNYTRPRVHLVYTATFLDQGARSFFSPQDVRIAPGVQHFLGIGAEWWLNSQRVITPM